MILVSGATGNVGRELVKYLLKESARVRVLMRDERKAVQFGDKVEIAIEDLDKPETLSAGRVATFRLSGFYPLKNLVPFCRLVLAATRR